MNALDDLVANSIEVRKRAFDRIDLVRITRVEEVRRLVRERLEMLKRGRLTMLEYAQQYYVRPQGVLSSVEFDNLQELRGSFAISTSASATKAIVGRDIDVVAAVSVWIDSVERVARVAMVRRVPKKFPLFELTTKSGLRITIGPTAVKLVVRIVAALLAIRMVAT